MEYVYLEFRLIVRLISLHIIFRSIQSKFLLDWQYRPNEHLSMRYIVRDFDPIAAFVP